MSVPQIFSNGLLALVNELVKEEGLAAFLLHKDGCFVGDYVNSTLSRWKFLSEGERTPEMVEVMDLLKNDSDEVLGVTIQRDDVQRKVVLGVPVVQMVVRIIIHRPEEAGPSLWSGFATGDKTLAWQICTKEFPHDKW